MGYEVKNTCQMHDDIVHLDNDIPDGFCSCHKAKSLLYSSVQWCSREGCFFGEQNGRVVGYGVLQFDVLILPTCHAKMDFAERLC